MHECLRIRLLSAAVAHQKLRARHAFLARAGNAAATTFLVVLLLRALDAAHGTPADILMAGSLAVLFLTAVLVDSQDLEKRHDAAQRETYGLLAELVTVSPDDHEAVARIDARFGGKVFEMPPVGDRIKDRSDRFARQSVGASA